jgi:hypothetical protein
MKEEGKMLIMDILTWEPAMTQDVIKHRTEEKIPPGIKEVGEWVDIAGGRAFRLVDVADPNLLFAMTSYWAGYGKKELAPVMSSEDMMKLLSSR